MPGPFKIGVLARRCNVSQHAIRFYERESLLPSPARAPSGHRLYDERSVRRLQFIRKSQRLGLTLGDVRGLLESGRAQPRSVRRQIVACLVRRLDEVTRRTNVLLARKRRLAEALRVSRGVGPAERRSDLSFVERYLTGAAPGLT